MGVGNPVLQFVRYRRSYLGCCLTRSNLQRKEEERKLEGEEELEEGWEYVEDGPAEIIWQGNEIIVKKPRKKVRKGTHSSTPLAIEVRVLAYRLILFVVEDVEHLGSPN